MADSWATVPIFQSLQAENYVAAATGAVVIYDHVLTFSQEVDLIWNRNWSFITVLYFIARYFGLVFMIGDAVYAICLNWTYSSYSSMYSAESWVQVIFLLAMQAILVIRVHALLNRSRGVLVFLATYYCLQAMATLVMGSVLTNTRALHGFFVSIGRCAFGSVVQTCVSDSNSSTGRGRLNLNITIVSLIFDTLLLSFALLAFVRHALEAKRLDGGWSTNMLVRTLVADQLMYFVCFLGWMSIALVLDYNDEANVFTDSTTNIISALYLASRALAMGAGPRMITGIRAIEKKTRQEGESMGGELSTIRFGIQEPLME